MNERSVTAQAEIARLRSIISSNIKKYRKSLRLSQQALADMCNLHRTYISDLENSKCNPTLSVLVTLSQNLNISLGQMLGFGSK